MGGICMKLYLKQMLRTMLNNKVASLLMIVAIALSSGVFLASQGIADQFIGNFEKPYLENTEGHDFLIQSTQPKDFFSLEGLEESGTKKITPGIRALGIYEDDVKVSLYGQEKNDLPSKSLKTGEVILSHRMMDFYDFQLGDQIKVNLYGNTQSFMIGKSTLNKGVFYSDDESQFALKMNYDDLRLILDGPSGHYNYVVAKAQGDVSKALEVFNSQNDGFKGDTLYDGQVIEQIVSEQKGIFTMMLVIVVFMSSVIIFGTFKLMITKRLSVIGTFISQGASRLDIFKILLLESFVYGFIGGILGSGLGTLTLFGLQRLTSPLRSFQIYEPFNPNYSYMVMALIFAVILSMASSLIPIIRTRKYPVKTLILNMQASEDHISYKKGLIGFILITGVLSSMILWRTVSVDYAPVLILIALIGVILFYPTAMALVLKPFIKILKVGLGKLGLTFKHVLHIGPIRGNITILIVVMTSVMLIISLGMGLEDIVIEAYESLNTDLFIENIQVLDQTSKETFLQGLKKYDFVIDESVQEEHMAFGKVNGDSVLVTGVDPKVYGDFNTYISFKNIQGEQLLSSLENPENRHLILTSKAAKRLNLTLDDSLNLTLNGYNQDYRVKGIVEGKLYNNGDLIFINGQDFEKDFNLYDSQIYVSVNNRAEQAKETLENYVKSYGGDIITMENMKANNIKNNQSLVNILGVFSIVAVIIGAFGAVNNMFIAYINRKKTLAVLSSVGMSSLQVRILLIKESILCFIIAMIVVVPFSHLMMVLVSNMSYKIGLPLDLKFSFTQVFPYILISGLLYVLSSLPLIHAHKKFNVVKAIRS